MKRDTLAIFKNVFCWLCNAETEAEVPTLCPDLHGDTLRSPLESFSALIDFKRLEEANGECSAGEILDEYLVSQRDSIANINHS